MSCCKIMKISWGWVHYFLRNSVRVRVSWKKILKCSGHVRVRWMKTPDMFRSCSGQVKTKFEMFGLCSGRVRISPEVECLAFIRHLARARKKGCFNTFSFIIKLKVHSSCYCLRTWTLSPMSTKLLSSR